MIATHLGLVTGATPLGPVAQRSLSPGNLSGELQLYWRVLPISVICAGILCTQCSTRSEASSAFHGEASFSVRIQTNSNLTNENLDYYSLLQ